MLSPVIGVFFTTSRLANPLRCAPVRSRTSLAVLVAILAPLGAACARAPENPNPASPAFNILIVVLDACRADKFGLYGFERNTTPTADALARDPDAVVFRRHHVQAAWTKPSVASILTGLYVSQHGVYQKIEREMLGKERGGNPLLASQALAEDIVTLPERLRDRGYSTFSVVKSYHLVPELGFGQGFDRVVTPFDSGSDRHRVEQASQMMRASEGPFFGYLHLNACHLPFPAGERHPGYMKEYGFPYPEAERRAKGIDFWDAEIRWAVRDGSLPLGADDVRFLHLVYEAGLRLTDEALLAPLLADLRAARLYDSTLLVVTADHGEELHEHRGLGHTDTLWQEVLHVPLIVKFPRGRRPAALEREIEALTSAVDLAPAVLAYARAEPLPATGGRDIFAGSYSRVAFAERHWEPEGALQALLHGHHKLLRTTGGDLLFDLATDPGETRDRAGAEPERLRAMVALAQRMAASLGVPRSAPSALRELDPEAVENLRSLGYLPPG